MRLLEEIIPVPLTTLAESEAKKRELLLNTEICVSLVVAFALKGVDAEGREVVRVALAEAKEAAKVSFVPKAKETRRIINIPKTFDSENEHDNFIQF